jgi:hypothetical protein
LDEIAAIADAARFDVPDGCLPALGDIRALRQWPRQVLGEIDLDPASHEMHSKLSKHFRS